MGVVLIGLDSDSSDSSNSVVHAHVVTMLAALKQALLDVRTSCYDKDIVITSSSIAAVQVMCKLLPLEA